MSSIEIKIGEPNSKEIQPEINEGGGVASAAAATSAFAGVKTIVVEKTQAALKVANEAKQLNLRLMEQKQLQQQPPQTPTATTTEKRRNSALNREENTDTPKSRVPLQMGTKRFRAIAPKPPPPPSATPPQPTIKPNLQTNYYKPPTTTYNKPRLAAKPAFAGPSASSSSRCGEIFVTNNAKKWTFICTFCQKTTRDIGAFVCHIKFKHMGGQYNDDNDDDGGDDGDDGEDDTYNNTPDQDYFDCANYLDVNVHTDADEPSFNGGQNLRQYSKTKTKDINKTKPPAQNSNYVLADENEENSDDVRFNTEVFDYDDEDGVEIVDEDNDDMMEGMDGLDGMEGDDDHLSFLKSNYLDDEFNGGGGGDATSSNASVRRYRSHVRGKAYCNLCDKTFQYYSLYRNHMIKHSNITPYKCQYCSKAFKSKQAIRYHMNTHTKEIQYKCELCPVTYGTENQFITHVLNHESDTCFPCMVCAKLLSSDQEREEHLETHTEERPFGCEFCNKRFRQKHHLSNHLKLHCQYRCDFCKEEFASTQTQRRPYACPNCEANPDIRQQVERQRSKVLNSADANPLEINYDNYDGQDEDPECVDLAEMISDEESETSMLVGPNGQKRVPCKYCTRTYKHNSALNYHMRMKHQPEWKNAMMK